VTNVAHCLISTIKPTTTTLYAHSIVCLGVLVSSPSLYKTIHDSTSSVVVTNHTDAHSHCLGEYQFQTSRLSTSLGHLHSNPYTRTLCFLSSIQRMAIIPLVRHDGWLPLYNDLRPLANTFRPTSFMIVVNKLKGSCHHPPIITSTTTLVIVWKN
jgi:hypothetical protein